MTVGGVEEDGERRESVRGMEAAVYYLSKSTSSPGKSQSAQHR